MAPVTSELGRLWQEDSKFKASLDYKGRLWVFLKVASAGHLQTQCGICTIGSTFWVGASHPCAKLEELRYPFPTAGGEPEGLALGCPEEVVPASPQQ